MQKVQIQTEIDVRTFLSQLGTKELEAFLREIPALLARRKSEAQKAKEVALIQRLNEECVLPESHWQRYNALSEKQEETELTPAESKEFFQLVAEERQLQLKRIHILGELAQLRGATLDEVAKDLGIKSPGYAE